MDRSTTPPPAVSGERSTAVPGGSAVTMKDIARIAGVSRSTVSNVVRGQPTVQPETRERVLSAIAATGFRPHALARALRERTSGVVALIVTDTGNPFYASLGVGIERAAADADVLMIVANSRCDPTAELALADALISRRVDGVIVGDMSVGATFPSILADNGIPVVLAGCGVGEDDRVGAVDTDDEQAMDAVVQHLHALGHRVVRYAGHSDDHAGGACRRAAAHAAAARLGLRVLDGEAVDDDGATAVITHNDLVAVEQLDALERAGLRVPEDISVVGFDDTPLAAHRRIDLTSVRCDSVAMGRIAARRILDAIAERRLATDRELLPCDPWCAARPRPAAPRHEAGARARRHDPRERTTTMSGTAAPRVVTPGSAPADHTVVPPMFPGGMLVDEREAEALAAVIARKCLFRYYGPGDGPREVELFEQEWRAHFDAPYALCMNAGSSALIAGLVAFGATAGTEVIVPAYTWNASANAVLAAGAIPVIAEVDDSLTLDPADVEARITPRTRAILPVHMRGGGSDMDALMAIAARHDLVVIEDACQAVGASYKGRRLGTIGHAGGYSLQFNKIITTGEGGMFSTSDEEAYFTAIDVHDCAGSLRRAGELPRYAGYNFRASEFTGAVGRVQLTRLEGILEGMRSAHRRIAERVAAIPGLELRRSNDPAGDAGIAVIAFTETGEQARRICAAISDAGIPAAPLYRPDTADLHVYPFWKPVLDAIAAAGQPAPSCPRTLALLERTVHVDIPPGLTDEQVELVASTIEDAARRSA